MHKTRPLGLGDTLVEQYFIRLRGQVQGPFPVEQLHALAKRSRFSRLHQVSTDGVTWERATKFPQLFPKPERGSAIPAMGGAADDGDLELAEPEPIGNPAVSGGAAAQTVDSPENLAARYAKQESTLWYYTQGAEELGPVSLTDLKALVRQGSLTSDDMLWTNGMDEWVDAGAVHELFPPVAVDPLAGARASHAAASSSSSLATLGLVAAILGFTCLPLLGWLGGIVLGHMALGEIRRGGGMIQGRGSAIAALVLSYGGLAFSVLVGGVILLVLIFAGAPE